MSACLPPSPTAVITAGWTVGGQGYRLPTARRLSLDVRSSFFVGRGQGPIYIHLSLLKRRLCPVRNLFRTVKPVGAVCCRRLVGVFGVKQ